MANPKQLADRFHAAMLTGDVDALRSILASDVTFTGPLTTATGRDECVNGLVEMAKIITRDDVETCLTDDNNVLTWSTMQTNAAPPTETATWLQIRNGQIAAIRTVFDARHATPNGR
jgi:hypothetical protein